MNERQAGSVWRELRGLGFNAVARYIEKGELKGKHAVEVEPRPAIGTQEISVLLAVAETRGIDLAYGKTPRRVLVLS